MLPSEFSFAKLRVLSRRIIGLALAMLALMPATSLADGWESLDVPSLIARSRYVGIGQLTINGKFEDGWLKGTLTFSQQIYSSVGEQKNYPVRIAPKTVPGKTQNWPHLQRGIWFVLKSGDAYEPVNHPSCWMEESQAAAVANQAYKIAESAFAKAKAGANGSSSGSTTQSSDASDSGQSVAAYGAMVAATDNLRHIPFQDKNRQSQDFYRNVMDMLHTAGIKPPIGGDLTSPGKENEFLAQVRQLLGPAAGAIGEPTAQGTAGRASQLAAAQHNVASVYLEFIRATLGSKNPAESLKNMGPIPLQAVENGSPAAHSPSGPGFPAPGPAGASSTAPPQFHVPTEMLSRVPAGASRKQMLGLMMGSGSPAPRPGPGPRPGPPGPR